MNSKVIQGGQFLAYTQHDLRSLLSLGREAANRWPYEWGW